MSEEKDYTKRTLVTTEEETSAHKKKSKTSSKSSSRKRSDHKHDYEPVIIESGLSQEKYYWVKRCKVCGRVEDNYGWFMPNAKKGLVKKKETVKLKSGGTYTFEIFYSFRELQKLFPGTAILRRVYNGGVEYEEVK